MHLLTDSKYMKMYEGTNTPLWETLIPYSITDRIFNN